MAYIRKDLTKDIYKPGEIAKMVGVSISIIQRWGNEGVIPFKKTHTGRRFLPKEDLINFLKKEGVFYEEKVIRKDVIYARVSSHKQKENGDLDRQVSFIVNNVNGLSNLEVLSEVGSGLNDKRAKLLKLIKMISNDEVSRVFITYKDRLTRFGFNYLKFFCELNNVELIVTKNKDKDKSLEEELTEDLIAIITSFSGRLYELRSHSNKKNKEKLDKIINIIE